MSMRILTSGVLLMLSASVACADPHPRVRGEFAAKMAHVQPGMKAERVQALLGPPDDVMTAADGITTTDTQEVWRYGATRHRAFASLGVVYFDREGKVQYVYGGHGDPPDPSVVSEEELGRVFDALAAMSPIEGWRYDPLQTIRAVNLLQPLGKEKALAAIQEFLRVSDRFEEVPRQGVFLVLRVLFEIPEDTGAMPTMMIGAPHPEGPKDPRVIPRFPIEVVDGAPLLLTEGYSLGGKAEPPEAHLAFFRDKGRLRKGPLVPSATPIDLVDRLERSPAWWIPDGQKDRMRAMLINEVLRLLDTIHDSPVDAHGLKFTPARDAAERWKQIQVDLAKRAIRWNAAKGCYTFEDGTTRSDASTGH